MRLAHNSNSFNFTGKDGDKDTKKRKETIKFNSLKKQQLTINSKKIAINKGNYKITIEFPDNSKRVLYHKVQDVTIWVDTCDSISTQTGKVICERNVKNVKSETGEIVICGNCERVSTVTGDVTVERAEHVETVTGDIHIKES